MMDQSEVLLELARWRVFAMAAARAVQERNDVIAVDPITFEWFRQQRPPGAKQYRHLTLEERGFETLMFHGVPVVAVHRDVPSPLTGVRHW